MGAWETGLYQNDVSLDVRDDYISKLKSGKSDEEALREILQEYSEEFEDVDCKYDAYLGLADTLWKKGRLTDEIKTKALEMIEEDRISERWESDQIRKARGKVLDKLEQKLNSQMPERKKIAIHKPYVLGWEEGDVYTFQIKEKINQYEQYVGWYVMFYVDRIYKEDWYVHGIQDEVADVYFFVRQDKPQSVEDLFTAKNVCFLIGGKNGNRYRSYILECSKRSRPKDLTFLGKCDTFSYPPNDVLQNNHFFWSKGVYERDILWGYEDQLKYEKQCKNNEAIFEKYKLIECEEVKISEKKQKEYWKTGKELLTAEKAEQFMEVHSIYYDNVVMKKLNEYTLPEWFVCLDEKVLLEYAVPVFAGVLKEYPMLCGLRCEWQVLYAISGLDQEFWQMHKEWKKFFSEIIDNIILEYEQKKITIPIPRAYLEQLKQFKK